MLQHTHTLHSVYYRGVHMHMVSFADMQPVLSHLGMQLKVWLVCKHPSHLGMQLKGPVDKRLCTLT